MKKFVQKALIYSVYSLIALTLCFLTISSTHAAARKPAAPPTATARTDPFDGERLSDVDKKTYANVGEYANALIKKSQQLMQNFTKNQAGAAASPTSPGTENGAPTAEPKREPKPKTEPKKEEPKKPVKEAKAESAAPKPKKAVPKTGARAKRVPISPDDCYFKDLAQVIYENRMHPHALGQICSDPIAKNSQDLILAAYMKLLAIKNTELEVYSSKVLHGKPLNITELDDAGKEVMRVIPPKNPHKSPKQKVHDRQCDIILYYFLEASTGDYFINLLRIVRELFLIKQTDPDFFKHITPENITRNYFERGGQFVYDEKVAQEFVKETHENVQKNVLAKFAMIQESQRHRLENRLSPHDCYFEDLAQNMHENREHPKVFGQIMTRIADEIPQYVVAAYIRLLDIENIELKVLASRVLRDCPVTIASKSGTKNTAKYSSSRYPDKTAEEKTRCLQKDLIDYYIRISRDSFTHFLRITQELFLIKQTDPEFFQHITPDTVADAYLWWDDQCAYDAKIVEEQIARVPEAVRKQVLSTIDIIKVKQEAPACFTFPAGPAGQACAPAKPKAEPTKPEPKPEAPKKAEPKKPVTEIKEPDDKPTVIIQAGKYFFPDLAKLIDENRTHPQALDQVFSNKIFDQYPTSVSCAYIKLLNIRHKTLCGFAEKLLCDEPCPITYTEEHTGKKITTTTPASNPHKPKKERIRYTQYDLMNFYFNALKSVPENILREEGCRYIATIIRELFLIKQTDPEFFQHITPHNIADVYSQDPIAFVYDAKIVEEQIAGIPEAVRKQVLSTISACFTTFPAGPAGKACTPAEPKAEPAKPEPKTEAPKTEEPKKQAPVVHADLKGIPVKIGPKDCLFEDLAQLLDENRTHPYAFNQIGKNIIVTKYDALIFASYIKLLTIESEELKNYAELVLNDTGYLATTRGEDILQPSRYPHLPKQERVHLVQLDLLDIYLEPLEKIPEEKWRDACNYIAAIIRELFLIKQTDPKFFEYITHENIADCFFENVTKKHFSHNADEIAMFLKDQPDALAIVKIIVEKQRQRDMNALKQSGPGTKPEAGVAQPKKEDSKSENKAPAKENEEGDEEEDKELDALADGIGKVTLDDKEIAMRPEDCLFPEFAKIVLKHRNNPDPLYQIADDLTAIKNKNSKKTGRQKILNHVIITPQITNILPILILNGAYAQLLNIYQGKKIAVIIPQCEKPEIRLIWFYCKLLDITSLKDSDSFIVRVIQELFLIQQACPEIFNDITPEAIAIEYLAHVNKYTFDIKQVDIHSAKAPKTVRKQVIDTIKLIQKKRREQVENKLRTLGHAPKPNIAEPKKEDSKSENKAPAKENEEEEEEDQEVDALATDMKRLDLGEQKLVVRPEDCLNVELAKLLVRNQNNPNLYTRIFSDEKLNKVFVAAYVKLLKIKNVALDNYASRLFRGQERFADSPEINKILLSKTDAESATYLQLTLIHLYFNLNVAEWKQETFSFLVRAITELFKIKFTDPELFKHITPEYIAQMYYQSTWIRAEHYFNDDQVPGYDEEEIEQALTGMPESIYQDTRATLEKINEIRENIKKKVAQNLESQSKDRLTKLKEKLREEGTGVPYDERQKEEVASPSERRDDKQDEDDIKYVDDQELRAIKRQLIFSRLAYELYSRKDNPEQLYAYLSSSECKEFPLLLVIMYMRLLHINPNQEVRTEKTIYYDEKETEGKTVYVYGDLIVRAAEESDVFVYTVLLHAGAYVNGCNSQRQTIDDFIKKSGILFGIEANNVWKPEYLGALVDYYLRHIMEQFLRCYEYYCEEYHNDKKIYEMYTEDEKRFLTTAFKQRCNAELLTDIEYYHEIFSELPFRTTILDAIAEMSLLKKQGLLERLDGEFIANCMQAQKINLNQESFYDPASTDKYENDPLVQDFLKIVKRAD